jgi:cell division protein FtsA
MSARQAGVDHATIPARVLGVGHQRARGVKAGVVVDLAEAERCIRETIAQAEHMAGHRVETIVLAVACGRLQSLNFCAKAQLGHHPVNAADIGRVMAAGQSFAERDGRRLIHLNRINWRLDGQTNVREPKGMRGALIEADLHAVTADEAALRNLLIAVERTRVQVTGVVAAPFAAGIAVSTPEERRFGVTVLDMGAGVTTLSYFAEGHLLNTDVVTIGGTQVTNDIARNLTISLAEAERIKTLYGNLAIATSDEHEIVAYAQAHDESGRQPITRARLRRIIRPRVEETFRILRERIERNKFSAFASTRIVLTGGASQLAGSGELAAHILGRAVRSGRPRGTNGLAGGIALAPFATVCGTLQSLFVPGACVLQGGGQEMAGPSGGYLGQVGNWLRESF